MKRNMLCSKIVDMKLLGLIAFFIFASKVVAQPLNVFDVARTGTVEQAKALLKSDPKIFNTTNSEGYSPLTLACYRSNNDVAKLLLDNGSDINKQSPMGTPLMASVVKGNLEMAKILLEKKADPDLTDTKKTTALIYAVQFKNIEMIKLLLEYDPNQSQKDDSGKTAFEYAVFSNNQEIINLFKK